MSLPARRRAVWSDLWHLPPGLKAEILDGTIETMPSPSVDHQLFVSAAGGDISGPFMRSRGGPGGWWIVPDVDVALGPHDVVRPDLSGWRKERVPVKPQRPVDVVPDWVCEVLSPSNGAYDRVTKMELYRRYGVAFVWLVDPALRTIEAYRLETLYVRLGAWSTETEARIEPFDAVPLDVAGMFAVLGEPTPG